VDDATRAPIDDFAERTRVPVSASASSRRADDDVARARPRDVPLGETVGTGMRIRIRRVGGRVGEVDRPWHGARGRSGRRLDTRVARREPREDRFGTRLTLLGSEGRFSRQAPASSSSTSNRAATSGAAEACVVVIGVPQNRPAGSRRLFASPEARRDRAFRQDARLQAGAVVGRTDSSSRRRRDVWRGRAWSSLRIPRASALICSCSLEPSQSATVTSRIRTRRSRSCCASVGWRLVDRAVR
jgi:hypothetical protein